MFPADMLFLWCWGKGYYCTLPSKLPHTSSVPGLEDGRANNSRVAWAYRISLAPDVMLREITDPV
jgi:hypothetical protein